MYAYTVSMGIHKWRTIVLYSLTKAGCKNLWKLAFSYAKLTSTDDIGHELVGDKESGLRVCIAWGTRESVTPGSMTV